MAEHILTRKLTLDLPLEQTFKFFSDAANLGRITPPELEFRMLTPKDVEMKEGTKLDYKLKLYKVPFGWRTLITEWNPPYSFTDESLKGPYKQWIHRHTFTETETGGTLISDEVRYRLPFEPFGDIVHWLVRKELEKIFDFRQKSVAQILQPEKRFVKQAA